MRNAGIDVLRGISILLVVIHHVGIRIGLKNSALSDVFPKKFLNALIFSGLEAVYIFFVISGFLIATNAIARWGSLDAIHLPTFYRRRAARILPCLLVLLPVLCVLHLSGVDDYVIHKSSQSLSGAVLSVLGFYLNWYEGRTGYLPGNWDVLWSLSIEEVFYIAFPLVGLFARKSWVLVSILVVLALSLPFSRAALADNEIWQEKAYLPGMAAIAMGVLAAIVGARFRLSQRWRLQTIRLIGFGGLIASIFFQGKLWPVIGNAILLLLTFSSACVLLFHHWNPRTPSRLYLMTTGWLRFGGRLSYEIYLSHMFLVWPITALYKESNLGERWGFLLYLPAVLASWLLGWLVARYISIPLSEAATFRRMGDLLSSLRVPRRA